jgi:CheY-like chemotaxis protein/HPt (histidine-containing phosphotransfer) domain-containing protein
VLGSLAAQANLWDWRWDHAVVQALGVCAALTVAALILLLRRYRLAFAHHLWTACALLAMGVLDGLAASVAPEDTFAWLQSLAMLVGGMLFALCWLPERFGQERRATWLAAIVVLVVILVGVYALLGGETFPVMVRQGALTPAAKAIHLVAGVFYFAAAIRLVLRYRYHPQPGDLLFAGYCLLFGMAGVLLDFTISLPAASWWLFLRVTLNVILLGYALVILRRTLAELQSAKAVLERRRAEPFVAAEAAANVTASPSSLNARGPLRVLLAEDNLVNQTVAIRLLEKWGHHITVAGSGREAMTKLDQEPFDLMLLDLQMPDMDGFEATRRIRQKEIASGQHLPIVALTAHASKEDRDRCLKAGMDGYLAKPIEAAALFAALEDAMAHAPVPALRNAAEVRVMVVDWKVALKQVGGDSELLRDLVHLFLAELPRWLKALHQAVADGNAAKVRQLAHTVKGALGQLGARAAYDAALRLESLGQHGNLAEAEDALADLESDCRRLLPLFSAFDFKDAHQGP